MEHVHSRRAVYRFAPVIHTGHGGGGQRGRMRRGTTWTQALMHFVSKVTRRLHASRWITVARAGHRWHRGAGPYHANVVWHHARPQQGARARIHLLQADVRV